jgi:hypothetical protein
MEIGKIIDISPREAWKHEAYDFTPWLSENLVQLGDALDLQLESEGTEVSVGPFSADILAKDAYGRVVLIENQLEPTDHNHLGQILTYLAGLNAEIVIWVATEFREPHLSAINWLNEHTTEQFAFFAVRLRVVRINNSIPAPVFDILARPNEWERSMQRKVREVTGESSIYATSRRDFWELYLSNYPDDESLGVQVTGNPSNWMATPEGVGLFVAIYKAKNEVGVFLRGPRGMSVSEVQSRLAPYADKFEELVGAVRYIGSERNHPADRLRIDTDNSDNWERATLWLHDRAHKFLEATTTVFRQSKD